MSVRSVGGVYSFQNANVLTLELFLVCLNIVLNFDVRRWCSRCPKWGTGGEIIRAMPERNIFFRIRALISYLYLGNF